MTDISPRKVIQFPKHPPLRLVHKSDCQREGLIANLHDIAGISPELAEKQRRARAVRTARELRDEAFKEHVCAVGLDETLADWERFIEGMKP